MPRYENLDIKFYNTLKNKKETFTPRETGKVGMYVCGITPYDLAHIGNARPAVVFDTLFRFLKEIGYDTTYVRNFTDVDDKIINKMNDTGESLKEVTEKYISIYLEDMDALNVSTPTHQPKVTETIDEIVEIIRKNVENGFAYVTDSGDVMYDITKFEKYGQLSNKKLDELNAGERVAVNKEKKNPGDFALWKAAKPGEPFWESPWSNGRPGWHIECSAMSEKLLGPQFDIHGGGEDLQFPHHENEIAQSHAANCNTCSDYRYVNYWLHNAFINVGGEKMSKSLGNFTTVHELLEHYHGEVLRFWILSTHYRKPLDLNDEALAQAKANVKTLYTALLTAYGKAGEVKENVINRFNEALADDLNTSAAVAIMFEEAKAANKGDVSAAITLREMGNVMGLLQHDAESYLRGGEADDELEIMALVVKRGDAKEAKDWATADKIRDELTARGIVLEDKPNGDTFWRRK